MCIIYQQQRQIQKFNLQFLTDKNGYGSRVGEKSASVTKAIYNQYKNILLNWKILFFTFPKIGEEVADRESIYIMNFSSSRIKEKLDEGNLEFTFKIKTSVC